MKETEKIDDIFSNAMDNFGVEPPNNLQDAIAEKRGNIDPEEGNNNKNYFIIIITAMAILFAALFFLSNEQQKLADAKEKFKTKNESSKNTNASNNRQQLIKSNESNNETSNHENTTNNTESISKTNDKKNSTNHSEANLDEYVKPALNQETKKENITSRNKVRKHKIESIHINMNRDCILQEPIQSDNENTEVESGTKINNIIKQVLENRNIENLKVNENKSENKTIVKTDSMQVDTLINRLVNIVSAVDSTSNSIVSEIVTKKDTLKKILNKSIRFIEPQFGISFGQNKFSKNNVISKNQLIDSIKITQPIYNFGINLGFKKNKFTIKAGLAIMQWKEQLGYSYTSQQYVSAIGDSIIINGTDTIIKRNIPIEVLTTTYKSNGNKNTNSFIQIPVYVGYNFNYNKFDFELGIGVLYSRLIASKGNFKDYRNNKLVNYSNKSQSPFSSNHIVSVVSFGAAYNINDRLKLIVYLPINIGINNIYKNDYTVVRRLNTMGTQIGVRFNISKRNE